MDKFRPFRTKKASITHTFIRVLTKFVGKQLPEATADP